MTTIRDMNENDAAAVSDLFQISWRETYEPIIGAEKTSDAIASRFSVEKQTQEVRDENVIALVAEDDDGKIIGAAMASMESNRHQAWLDRMHVVPAAHGSGVADDLMHAVFAKHTGLHTLALSLVKGNERAKAFYEKHGFVVSDEVDDCDDGLKGVPTYVMTKLLQRG